MNKKEAEKSFKVDVDYKGLTKTDKRLAWNDYTEHLYQSGLISEKQLYNWDQPDFVKK